MAKREVKKTPNYVKRSIDKYRADKKTVTMLFNSEQWQKLTAAGFGSGADIKRFLLEYIEKK